MTIKEHATDCCSPATECEPRPYPEAELAGLAKALGHPMRVQILRHLLQQGECLFGSLAKQLPAAQSTISQHFKKLKEAGLVRGEVDGTSVCYCADAKGVERLKELVQRL